MKKSRKHYSGKELLEIRKKERERKILEEKERELRAKLKAEFGPPTIQISDGYSMRLTHGHNII
jgi:hypothetical protein